MILKKKMTMLKTVLSLMLLTGMLLSCISVNAAPYEAVVSLSSDRNVYHAEEIFFVKVTVSEVYDRFGLDTVSFNEIRYDSAKLQYIGVHQAVLPTGWTLYGSQMPLTFIDYSGKNPLREGGKMHVILQFKVLKDASEGSTEISIKGSGINAVLMQDVSMDFESLPLNIVSGDGSQTCDHQFGPWFPVDEKTHGHTCSVCGKTEVKEHRWDGGALLLPTPERPEESRMHRCLDCGATKIVSASMEGHVHKFPEEWKSDDVNHWKECSCGLKEQVLPHIYDQGKQVKAPTCTEEGIFRYTCTVCGHTKDLPIPATGHHFSSWKPLDDTHHQRVCECGATETKEHRWVNGNPMVCLDCGAVKETETTATTTATPAVTEQTTVATTATTVETTTVATQTETTKEPVAPTPVETTTPPESSGKEPVLSPAQIAVFAVIAVLILAVPILIAVLTKKKNK